MHLKHATFIIIAFGLVAGRFQECVPTGTSIRIDDLEFGGKTSLQDLWHAQTETPFRRFPDTKRVELRHGGGKSHTILITRTSELDLSHFDYYFEKSFDKNTFSHRVLFCEDGAAGNRFVAHMQAKIEDFCFYIPDRGTARDVPTVHRHNDFAELFDNRSIRKMQGGFGEVKRAMIYLGASRQEVALKRIPISKFSPSEAYYQRRMAMMPHGPGRFYGCQFDDDYVFLASEWFGKRLEDIVDPLSTQQHSLAWKLEMDSKLLEMLSELEEMRVSHGDIKHSNILLDKNDNPRLIDWDAAKPLGNPEVNKGTPPLMHPARNLANERAIPQFDRYSMAWVITMLHSPEGVKAITYFHDSEGSKRVIPPEYYRKGTRTVEEWAAFYGIVDRVFQPLGGSYKSQRLGRPRNLAKIVVDLMNRHSSMTLADAMEDLNEIKKTQTSYSAPGGPRPFQII